jgi:hypothetical protein
MMEDPVLTGKNNFSYSKLRDDTELVQTTSPWKKFSKEMTVIYLTQTRILKNRKRNKCRLDPLIPFINPKDNIPFMRKSRQNRKARTSAFS